MDQNGVFLFLLIALLAHISSLGGVSEKNSGFYFDNGMGQTEMEFMDLEDQEILREEMLTLLGLSHAPKTNVHKMDKKSLGNHTIPHFMKDIYNSLTEEENTSGEMKSEIDKNYLLNNQFGLTLNDIQTINESDIIISFANRGHQDDLQWTQLFWFDTNELPNSHEQKLLRSELRLYKGKSAPEFGPKEEFVIKCYQLVEGSTGETNLLDSLTMKFEDQGWLILDLTKAVKSWQLDFHTNQGLLVEIVRKDAELQLHPTAIGLATNREQEADKEAFMVAYFKSTDEDAFYHQFRIRRDAEEKSENEVGHREKRESSSGGRKSRRNQSRRKKQKYSDIEQDFSYSNVYRDFYGGKHRFKQCQLRMFRVSFRDLGWEDWIIAPDDYEAFYCHGECSFPLNSHMNATNHAIVQTLIHLMEPHNVPKPCCAPTKLSAISVLYFDESSNVILKKYQNMVVKSCGCH